ncbi:MAG: putative 2-aminoethylphosphonate ABC transporter substrate-binding protein [Rhizobiales bacterium]|jgi:iron(III) transport system substrate-binding protein|nr:putative 2-aminoethylphosphonate ABC transporter substrate-binding protein [Hyphomicrobiales bacterium]
MRAWLAACFIGSLSLAFPSIASAQKTKVMVYTALENNMLAPYKAAIEKAVPEADVVWFRDSTGVITARVLAEKSAPKADLVLGMAATSLLDFKTAGLLQAYEPKGASALKPIFRDPAAPYSWTGTAAYLGVLCFNTAEGAKDKIAVPTSWKDLLNPALKDKIVMPHPASSGTGYLMVAGWLQSMGEKAGWEFMDGLHQNIASYLHSGSAPCVQAAHGERTVGIGFDMRGAIEKTRGAPIEVIVPKEGTGWEIEAAAIVKGTKNLAIAEKIADWAATKDASEVFSKYHAIVAYPGVQHLPPNYPANGEAGMIKNDLAWMAKNRDRILAEWSKRYESKSAPKKQ